MAAIQGTTYNSRVTSEALEKKFRDTFTSQGGSELIGDLYASGVIIPVVDFTSSAEGSALRADLQSAADLSSTGGALVGAGFNDFVISPGFWRISGVVQIDPSVAGAESAVFLTTTPSSFIFSTGPALGTGASLVEYIQIPERIVYVDTGQAIRVNNTTASVVTTLQYRQVADLYGSLSNPVGFTFQ